MTTAERKVFACWRVQSNQRQALESRESKHLHRLTSSEVIGVGSAGGDSRFALGP